MTNLEKLNEICDRLDQMNIQLSEMYLKAQACYDLEAIQFIDNSEFGERIHAELTKDWQ